MAGFRVAPYDRNTQPRDGRAADAALQGSGAGEADSPAYDTSQKGYAGISAGALDSIQDLHAARNFAEMIVDTVREGLLVLDFDLHVVAANESFYKRFAVRPEEAVGRLVYELGHGEWDMPELRTLLEEILPHEKTFNDFEVDHEFEGLGRRQMLLNARRLDAHEMILLAVEDATERRQSERELRKSERDLRDANAALEERTRQVRKLARALTMAEQEERRRIAHILHEDLQQILFGASMAAHAGDVEGLGAVLGEAMELTRTLSHSLSPPSLVGEDLEDLLRSLAEATKRQFGIDVTVDVAAEAGGGAPLQDPAFRVLLYQLVRELLFNVAKHAGTERARVAAERTDRHVRVVVEDEGAGFDPALLGAAGLGLQSVRERLELVGGRMEIASEPGKGARITMEFPLEPE